MSANYDFGDFKKDATDRPRDKAWTNWAKFTKVGDTVQGYIRDVFYRKPEGVFKESRGITLEQPGGQLINVRINRYDFVLAKTNKLRLNDPLTMVFEEELPSKAAGLNPTKVYGFYGKNLPENANEKTVEELELIDMGIANTTVAAPKDGKDEDFEKMAGTQQDSSNPLPPKQD